jgi:hypothetical protein
MKKIILMLFIAAAFFSCINKVHATVLYFDDVTTEDGIDNIGSYNGSEWTDIYAGLKWTNIAVVKKTHLPDTGYERGVISGDYAVLNAWVYDATVSGINGETFTFNDAYFTSAWSDPNNLTVSAYKNDEIVGSKTVTLNTQTPQLISFNYQNIDRLFFHSDNNQFVMDNMRINEAVPTPEPSAMVLGLLSFGGLLGFRNRKRIITA